MRQELANYEVGMIEKKSCREKTEIPKGEMIEERQVKAVTSQGKRMRY